MSRFNQLVSECFDFAETQAKRECAMTMKEWNYYIEQLLSKIDDAEYTVTQVENDCFRK